MDSETFPMPASIPIAKSAGIFLKRFRSAWTRPALLASCLLLAACASQTFDPKTAPEYVIVRDFTPFFRLGPQQGGGPDASLRPNTRVKLLRKEMGFSLVQLEDLRNGYVANENIAVAPPRPPTPSVGNTETSSTKRGGRSRGPGGPFYSGPAVNDIPLPDRNMPAPDLSIDPEVVPDAVPSPSATPAEKPKYRY